MSTRAGARRAVRWLPYFGGRISTDPAGAALRLAGDRQGAAQEIDVADLEGGSLG